MPQIWEPENFVKPLRVSLKSAQEQMNVWSSQLYIAGDEAENIFFSFFFSLGNLLAESP